ncbi:MAG: hypothetical protein WDM80_09440 [Limisphaerales bacterium]
MPLLIVRILALLRTVFPALATQGTRLWAWAQRNALLVWLTSQFAEGAAKSIFRAAVVVALMVAYGVFLLVFWSYVTGTTFREIISLNPFQGMPAGVAYLVSHTFPIKFMVGSSIAYIQWRFTVIGAGIVFSRAVRFMVGT